MYRRIGVSLVNGDNEVQIVTCDDGCGMQAGLAEQIFHAFVTTKPEGTGSGLNVEPDCPGIWRRSYFVRCEGRQECGLAFILRVSSKFVGVDEGLHRT